MDFKQRALIALFVTVSMVLLCQLNQNEVSVNEFDTARDGKLETNSMNEPDDAHEVNELKIAKSLTDLQMSLLTIAARLDSSEIGTPSWLLNNPPQRATGALKSDKTALAESYKISRSIQNKYSKHAPSFDDEAYEAVRRFFWGLSNGIVLEMGALDGQVYSVSEEFLPLGWHRILIEATPKWHAAAKKASPDASYIAAAVCKEQTFVHFLSRPRTDSAVNGIAEFMSEAFMKEMHPTVYSMATNIGTTDFDLANVNWGALPSPLTTPDDGKEDRTFSQFLNCVQIDDVLKRLSLTHVNFFVLDVEGGELEVLKSIDFSVVVFDVLCVETEGLRAPGYGDDVRQFLEARSFEFIFSMGRNSWFQHRSFQPSSFKIAA